MSSTAARAICSGAGNLRTAERGAGCRGASPQSSAIVARVSWRRTEAERAIGFAAEAEAGLDDLLPGVDVVLVLAGEELAHLGVDAVDVGGQREDDQQQRERKK